MGAFKKLNQQDAYISTYTARKSWTASGSQYQELGIQKIAGISGSGTYIPVSTSIDDSRLVFQSINHLYYSNFSSSLIPTSKSFDNYLQSSFNVSGSRYINEYVTVFSLPKEIFGTHIEPSSIELSIDPPPSDEGNYVFPNYVTDGGVSSSLDIDNQYTIPANFLLASGSTSIVDDGEGNLYLENSSPRAFIGNVIYPHGNIIITDNYIAQVFANDYNAIIKWKSNLPLYTHNYHCRVKANELNFSLNKTAVDQLTGEIKDNISGSAFQPYITTLGLYNDANELVAVAKTASPIPKSTQTDMSFHIKLDMNFGVNKYN